MDILFWVKKDYTSILLYKLREALSGQIRDARLLCRSVSFESLSRQYGFTMQKNVPDMC